MFSGSSLVENSVRYLFNLSSDLQSSQASTILKSYYLTRVRKLTLNGGITLPQTYTKASKRCLHCSLLFNDEKPSYKIQAERKQNKFIKKLLIKSNNDLPLTRYQSRFLSNLKRKGNDVTHNKLIIKCRVCQKELHEKLPKPKKVSIALETPMITSRKKKKKKRDIFIGLKKEAVLSVTPHSKSRDCNESHTLTKTVINNVQNKALLGKTAASPISTKFNTKDRKKNQQDLKNLKKVLDSNKKTLGSTKLKQFLTSI